MIRIRIEGFLDGARVQKELTEPSRWEVQEAERVTIDIGDAAPSAASAPSSTSSPSASSSFLSIDLVQLPRCLSSSKVGVGAVLWDGGIVLAALLASLGPPSALLGEVVVELGAGVGAPSLAAAKRGARVISTDKEAAVRGVLRANVERSGLLSPSCRLPPEPGKIALRGLEFGTEQGDAAAAALADAVGGGGGGGGGGRIDRPEQRPFLAGLETSGIDLVLAADCVYSDGDGESPDPEALCRAAARLLLRRRGSCSNNGSGSGSSGSGGSDRDALSSPPQAAADLSPPSSRVWIASEERDAETHALFERAAARHFASVRRLQLPAEVFGGGGSAGEGGKSGSESRSSPWGHVRVFELAGAGAGTEGGGLSRLSAAEMRALKRPRKRGWP